MSISDFEFKVRGLLEKQLTKYRNSIPRKAVIKLTEEIIKTYKTKNETEYSRWISITEKLPEKDGNYIVTACDEGASYGEGIWYDTVVVFANYNDNVWTWDENGTEYDLTDIVTHWMPMPKPAE